MESLFDELAYVDFQLESAEASSPPPSPPLSACADNPENLYPKDYFKFRLGNYNPWGNEYLEFIKVRNFLIDEMTGSFVGAMPAEDFLRKFMRYTKTMPAPPAEYDFSNISGKDGELKMYPLICEAINKSGICPGFKLVTVANDVDGNGIRLRPDLALLDKKLTVNKDSAYNDMQFWLEIKASEAAGAFSDLKDPNSVEKNKGDSTATRGQLISYAAAVLSRQHRLHLFSICICGHYARFFRWDRSGCIVSAQFDLHKEPHLLAYFFWCYSRLTTAERGFDPTVSPASEAEAKLLRNAVVHYEIECKQQNRKNVTALRKPKDKESPWPAFKMQVDFNGVVRKLIVGRPFWGSDSPCGRATRGYTAYDTVANKLVFLKDSWRTDSNHILAEGLMYAKLKAYNVPFLPIILAAGDVKINGKPQKTVTQNYANMRFRPKWLLPCSRLDTLIHYRVVQELAYPLISATSSKEAVQAMRDTVEAIKVAYHSGKTLHRDISLGNVMISKTGCGCLNDWDHAIELTLRGTRHSFRTGTWQFISSSLLSDPSKTHEVHDDLESCFWVLLNVSLHYFKHEGVTFRLDIFNEYDPPEGNKPATGGRLKSFFLAKNQIRSAKWSCVPLNILLHDLARVFKRYLKSVDDLDDAEDSGAEDQFQRRYTELKKVDIILECFDRALASDEWPTNDAIDDQFEPASSRQLTQVRRNTVNDIIVTTGTKKSTHTMGVRAPKRSPEQAGLEETTVSKRARIVRQPRRNNPMAPPHLPPTLSLPAPPRQSPPQSPPRPVKRAYNTRANTQAKLKSKSDKAHKSPSGAEDVEMQEAGPSHPYVTRSKSKSNEAKRRQNLGQGSASKANGTKPTQVDSQKVVNANPAQVKRAIRANHPGPTKPDAKQTKLKKRKPWR